MACDCIQKSREEFLAHLRETKPDWNITEKPQYSQVALFFMNKPAQTTKLYMELEWEYTFMKKDFSESKPKKGKQKVIATFCPLCGVRYEPEETEAVNAETAAEDGN